MKPLKIGKLKIASPLFLSPMVDVTDLPFRLICRRAGAAMCYTEMIYIDAILHENKKTLNLLKTSKEDSPIGLQITGNNIEEFKKFARLPLLKNYDLIDINCGCPSIRITGNEAGSYLLQHPEKIAQMIKILKGAGYTVTAKIRLGFKENNVLKVAKIIEEAGADAITVHARLAIHGRDVPADWSWIKKVKESVKIPVIGNGDIFTGKDAKRMLEICDGVMVARGAIGDPLIFQRILNYLKLEKEEKFSVKKNIQAFKEYLSLENKIYGKEVDLGRIKYLGGKFLRGFNGASKAREELMKLKSIEKIEDLVDKLLI